MSIKKKQAICARCGKMGQKIHLEKGVTGNYLCQYCRRTDEKKTGLSHDGFMGWSGVGSEDDFASAEVYIKTMKKKEKTANFKLVYAIVDILAEDTL